MNDTPVQPPRGELERWTSALGNLARPWVLWSASSSASFATGYIPFSGVSLIEGAAYITAAWAGVFGLYGAKAIEERGKAKSEAAVAIAQSNPNTTSEAQP